MNLGDTFLNVNPESPRHLWVVITRSTVDGKIGIVNLTTRKPSSDDSCIINPVEHSFIEHETIIEYRKGSMIEDRTLERARMNGYVQMRTPVSPILLKRIQEGALASRFTQKAIQAAVRATQGQT